MFGADLVVFELPCGLVGALYGGTSRPIEAFDHDLAC